MYIDGNGGNAFHTLFELRAKEEVEIQKLCMKLPRLMIQIEQFASSSMMNNSQFIETLYSYLDLVFEQIPMISILVKIKASKIKICLYEGKVLIIIENI